MAERVYLGIDLGAESGRVMAGSWNGQRMDLQEIHRFPNGGVWVGESLKWDVGRLWHEIQTGLGKAAAQHGRNVVSVGVDTWGVDYVLLSKSGELLGLPFHYRDHRTRGVMDGVLERVSKERIFGSTGIQFMPINTLYQLCAARRDNPEMVGSAETFLMMSDFFHWCLCGAKVAEFSNATTTQFVDPVRRNWATGLMEELELPTHFLPDIVESGSRLGSLRTSLGQRTGLGAVDVVAPASHDTGSAVAAIPTSETGKKNWAYISSGTWSLMGMEVDQPILSAAALEFNLTNEGGVGGTFRLLKNIMGMWLIQQCRRQFESEGSAYDYAELVKLASEAPALVSFVDPDDVRFLNPPKMATEIRDVCRATGQPEPKTPGAVVRCALESLALKYAEVLGQLETLTESKVEVIHIVGGGSRNQLLNQWTSNACRRRVLAGPVETTVLGNVLVQALSNAAVGSVSQIREVVKQSSDLETYDPQEVERWQDARGRFRQICVR